MDPWDTLLADMARADEAASAATQAERARCVALLDAELEAGRTRGLSDAAPVMAILIRLRAAVAA